MQHSIAQQITDALTGGSPWLLPLVFFAGALTSLNPCAYPMMAAVIGYVLTQGDRSVRRSAALAAMSLLGLGLVYAMLGAVGSFVVPRLGLSRTDWLLVVGGVCVVAGAFMADIVPFELPGQSLLPRVWGRVRGLPGALVLGALLGLVATPCATAPLVAIVSVASAQNAPLYAGLLLFTYALGHGLPTILLGLIAGSVTALQHTVRYGLALQMAGGWVIIGVGIYLLAAA
jgi:cytochrome c biogenesis protein CcdA